LLEKDIWWEYCVGRSDIKVEVGDVVIVDVKVIQRESDEERLPMKWVDIQSR
jgi:hypothetical protein